MWWWTCMVAAAAASDGWAFRAGGHFAPSSHGVVDIVWARGPWTLALYTDTLEARLGPSFSRGRAWVAVRGEYHSAGLMITPWADGAVDLGRSRSASYVGVETGALRYGPGGLYGGAQASARYWVIGALKETTVDLPPDHPVLGA